MKVLTTGCFDLFHIGHVDYLRKIAEKYPDAHKVVAIVTDDCVERLKGKRRPICSEAARKTMLESCRFVDEVVVFRAFLHEDDEIESGHAGLIQRVMPDVFVRGPRSDYKKFRRFLEPHGIPLEIIEDVADYTTTHLLAQIYRKT